MITAPGVASHGHHSGIAFWQLQQSNALRLASLVSYNQPCMMEISWLATICCQQWWQERPMQRM
jgi:hypothetical protein